MQLVYRCIDKLINYAECNLLLKRRDADYVRNEILGILSLESYSGDGIMTLEFKTLDCLLEDFVSACVENGVFKAEEAEKYTDAVMGALSLPPSALEEKFFEIERTEGGERATGFFYDYCVANDYVKKSKLDKNPRFEENGLIITINKAKPEFRDAKKAASGNSVKGGYPKCTICRSNEGFYGRNKRTLRTVSIKIGGKNFFWQFSPYGYFYQHGIAVNEEHIPMHVDEDMFKALIDFVDEFPHYFIGCNAPLPRIGGSVLAHDHYQGGGEVLPLHNAKSAIELRADGFGDAKIYILDWPGTVVRISGENPDSVIALSERVRVGWLKYRDEGKGIINEDKDGVHSAISPYRSKARRVYEMNIILRNNVTSEKYPDGVFHAHPEFHMIKKESIGLIEAQGLFILPGRLESQMGEIEKLLAEDKPLPEELKEFSLVYDEAKGLLKDRTLSSAKEAVRKELGSICYRILENTAVFKTYAETEEFLKGLGFENV